MKVDMQVFDHDFLGVDRFNGATDFDFWGGTEILSATIPWLFVMENFTFFGPE